MSDDVRRHLRIDPPQLNGSGKDKDVRGEAVAALVRGDPELLLPEPGSESVEDRRAATCTTGIAAPVPADEDELRVRGVAIECEVDARQVVECVELEAAHAPARLRRVDDERERRP
jgi:hypothetical protein